MITSWSGSCACCATRCDGHCSSTEVNGGHCERIHCFNGNSSVIICVKVVEHHITSTASSGGECGSSLSSGSRCCHVAHGDRCKVNINEVDICVRHCGVLEEQGTSSGSCNVHDSTATGVSVGVTVLHDTLCEDGNSIFSEVETRRICSIDVEVAHGNNCSLSTSVSKRRANISESHMVHREVTHVGVGAWRSSVA